MPSTKKLRVTLQFHHNQPLFFLFKPPLFFKGANDERNRKAMKGGEEENGAAATEDKDSGAYNKEAVDETLKKLEENMNKAKEEIISFTAALREGIKSATKEATERLDGRHKKATGEFANVIDRAKDPNWLRYIIPSMRYAVRDHAVPYRVHDNSKFVFDAVKKGITQGIDCSTLKSFLAALPQQEFESILEEMRSSFYLCKG